MRRLLQLLALVLFVAGLTVSSLTFIKPPAARAAFNQSNIISDGVFDALNEQNTTSPGAIDTWLNQFPNSCISQNNGFAAPDVTGYSPSGPAATGGFSYGGDVSAGTVIFHAAHVYGLNPQVILTTMEKEEGLVLGDGPYGCGALAISAAMGDACPDSFTSHSYSGFELYSKYGTPVTSVSGTCVNTAHEVGFSRQLIVATWKFKFWEQRAEGNYAWNVQLTNYPNSGNVWDNSDDLSTCYTYRVSRGWRQVSPSSCPNGTVTYYDGNTTIDGTTFSIDNGPTAALYNYTPHFHGNQLFVSIFEGWFGSTQSLDLSAQPVWQSIFTNSNKTTSLGWNATLVPGQDAWAVVEMKNTGNITWTKNGGGNDVRLATYGWGRISPFCAGRWIPTSPNCTRAAGLSTNTSGGSTVAPGETGIFEFPLNAPTGVNLYNEQFGLVIDGRSTFPNGFMNFWINVARPSYAAQPVWQGVYANNTKSGSPTWNYSFTPGQNAWAVVVLKNKSNFTWTKGGLYDVRLATYNPWGRISPFCAGRWIPTSPNCTRAATFDETSVDPGANGTFEFNLNAPTGINTYNESFGPIVDGKSTFSSGFVNFQLTVHN